METPTSPPSRQQKTEQILLWSLVALGFIGFVDAIIITIHHFIPGPAPEYAFLLGIPTAPAGIIWYLVILGVTITYIRTKNPFAFSVLFALLSFEFLMGLVVFCLQTFVLQFFCEYAYTYVVVTILMFVIAIILYRKQGALGIP